MATTATVKVDVRGVREMREFIEKVTAYMQYTADLEDLFAMVKNDPSVCATASADACIASLRKKHGVTTMPLLDMGEG